jgi:cytoskeletal protein RodZ
MAEIAEELCLTQRYLRALEQNDLKSLPGIFFYKSFVRQYAALLGIPAKLIQPGLNALTEEGHAPRASPPPVRELDPLVQASNRYYFADRRIGVPVGTLAAVLVACSVFYGWWNKPPRPHLAQAPVTVVQPQPSTPTVQVSEVAGEDDMSHVVLNLSATEATWISITSDGKQIFSGMLQPSQTKTVSGLDAAMMKVGNAGGLEVRLNGKAIGPLGARGQVRHILFTPGNNFQILEPTPLPAPL